MRAMNPCPKQIARRSRNSWRSRVSSMTLRSFVASHRPAICITGIPMQTRNIEDSLVRSRGAGEMRVRFVGSMFVGSTLVERHSCIANGDDVLLKPDPHATPDQEPLYGDDHVS